MSANSWRVAGRLSSVHLVLACCFGLGAVAAWADVTLYEQAPSVEELEQKLLGGEKTGQKKFKTRAIVFENTALQEAESTAPKVQTSPQNVASTSSAATDVTASTPTVAQQSTQDSKNAVGFPIQFKINSAKLLPESLPYIRSIAQFMQKHPDTRLIIEGHTDISGNYQRNLALSRERAFAVMNHLIDHFGIDPMRLIPVGKGPMEPLPGHEPTDPKNRRVQILTVG